MNPEKREIKVREKNGSVKKITVLIPSNDNVPRLNIPPGGLHQDKPQLNLSEPVWVPPHLRKPSWKKQ